MANEQIQLEEESSNGEQYNIHTVELEGDIYPMGYRVVTQDLKSLGLRKNSNILQYPIGEWFCLPPEDVEEGKGDWGGIWLARTKGKANEYRKYMRKTRGVEARVFRAAIGEILYCNSGRVKTDMMYMFEEITEELLAKEKNFEIREKKC